MNRFEQALLYATEKHSGQVRKISHIPYILHPMEVAAIAATVTDKEDVLCAALLHDIVEDTTGTAQELCEKFGERVAALVGAETEQKRRELPADATWKLRKEESLAVLRESDDTDIKILWLSDKLSNMRSFHREFVKVGDDVWKNCHCSDPAEQAWYYRRIAELLTELSDCEAYKEYAYLTEKVFADVPKT